MDIDKQTSVIFRAAVASVLTTVGAPRPFWLTLGFVLGLLIEKWW